MRLDSWLIGLLIMSTVILTGMFVITDVSFNYDDVDLSSDLGLISQDFNYTDDVYNNASSMRSTLFDTGVDSGDTESSMFAGAFSAMRFLGQSFTLFGDMVSAAVAALGIPPFFVNIAISMAVLLVVFGMIYLVFRFQPS